MEDISLNTLGLTSEQIEEALKTAQKLGGTLKPFAFLWRLDWIFKDTQKGKEFFEYLGTLERQYPY